MYREWTGKRIDCNGDEYQIDSVFHDVRWFNGDIEHNAIEVSHLCGHIEIVSDESVAWDEVHILGNLPRAEKIAKIQQSKCFRCQPKHRIPEDYEVEHLTRTPGIENAL